MAVTQEQKYYEAEHLGSVDEPIYNLIGSFFAKHPNEPYDGLERVLERFPYIVTGDTVTDLFSLAEYVKSQPRFVTGSRASLYEMREPDQRTWRDFQGATNEILCEAYVRTHDMASGQGLISNRRLDEEIHGQFTCPDAILVALNDDTSVSVEKYYEFKSRLDDPALAGTEITRVKTLLQPNRPSYRVFKDALAKIIGKPPELIVVPDAIPLRAIVAMRAPIDDDTKKKMERNFDGKIECIELPNIRRFTYFVLQILVGNTPKQQDWEKYFIPVSKETAETSITIMQSRR